MRVIILALLSSIVSRQDVFQVRLRRSPGALRIFFADHLGGMVARMLAGAVPLCAL